MTAALDRAVANAMGLKSVHNCEKWVGLTDEEMWEAVRPLCNHDQIARALVEISKDEYQAIEAKLKAKNT